MIIVTNLQGNSEPIVDLEGTTIRQRLNENYELSFNAIKTPNNQYGYNLLQEEALVTYENENFIVKSLQELPFSKSVLAVHEFFEVIDDFVEAVLPESSYSIQQAMSHAFSMTSDWIFEIAGTFQQVFLRDFGNNNPIALLNIIIENFRVEYTVSSVNKRISIKERIGVETDEQVRFKYNLTSIQRDVDSNDVKTAVRVYYNPDNFGGYSNNVVYRSPLINQYRRTKWAPPIYLNNVTIESQALLYAQNQLQDKPNVSIAVEFNELQRSGYNANNIKLGDSLFIIDERLNLEDEARIVEIQSYPLDKNKSPSIILSNAQKKIDDLSINQNISQSNLNNIAVKQTNIYNGASITETDGILIQGRNGVTIRLNADIGFLIDRDGRQELYIDTNGNVNFDGRLNITENGQTLLEAYQDNLGGRLILNDRNGALNIAMGSESGDGDNRGGTIVIYDDGSLDTDRRVEMGVDNTGGGGIINLRNQEGLARITLNANSVLGPILGVARDNGIVQSFLTSDYGVIDGQLIATQQFVRDYVNSVMNP